MMNSFYPWGRPEHKRAKSDSGHTYAYGYPPYQPYTSTPLYATTPLPTVTHLAVPTGAQYLSPVSPPWATPALPGHSPPVVSAPLPPPGWDPHYAWRGGYERDDSPPPPPRPVIGELLSTADTYRHILWDVRSPPSDAQFYHYARDRTVPLPQAARDDMATSPPVRKMTLLCKHLPWKIEVTNPSGITYGDVLEHIYQNLQTAMTYGEWWIADDKKRNKVMEEVRSGKVGKTRREADGTHKVKKVDWLSDHTVLRGLGKDRKLIDERFIGEKDRETTWSIELMKPSEAD